MRLHEPIEPPRLFPAAMRFRLPDRPAMNETEHAEPQLVEFANHGCLLDVHDRHGRVVALFNGPEFVRRLESCFAQFHFRVAPEVFNRRG